MALCSAVDERRRLSRYSTSIEILLVVRGKRTHLRRHSAPWVNVNLPKILFNASPELIG